MAAKKQAKMTREEWLNKAVGILSKDLFQKNGYLVPKVIHVSVGFPYGSRGGKAIGQHWHPKASLDNNGQIYITPTLASGIRVLDVLVHEMVHAAVGNEAGHGPTFKKCAEAVGLTGKMRSTVAGPELEKLLAKTITTKLGPYPHPGLNVGEAPRKKQTTRMVKMECAACEYIVRGTMTKIIENGPVVCPCGEAMTVELPEEGD